MKQSILNRKIPSILGMSIIVIGIVATTFLVKEGNLLQSKAGPSNKPQNIRITNISDSSFTVTYTTYDSVIGTLFEGKNSTNLDQTILDDRDQLAQKINRYQAHSITVNSLDPETTYFFTITSGENSKSDNGKPFSIKTGSIINTPPSSQIPMAGKIINPDGTNPSDGIVTATIDNAQIVSTYLKHDGSYLLPLNNLRSKNLANYFIINKDTVFNIKVISGNYSSNVNVSPNQISPVPLITLSNNYDFSETVENKKINSSSSANFKNIIFPKQPINKKIVK